MKSSASLFVVLAAVIGPRLAPAAAPAAEGDRGAVRFNQGKPVWSFHESFDRNVLAPVYPESVIYDARSRRVRVHTPTIEVGRDHTLIVALRDLPAVKSGLPLDMDPVNAIHFMSSADGGATWSALRRFEVGYAINPAFIRTRGPETWLFYNARNSQIQDDNSVWYCKSSDNFRTWSKPQPIEVGYRVHLIAHNGIQLANGNLLLGFDYDRGNNSSEPFAYAKMDRAAAALVSTDAGLTWQRHGEIEVPNLSSIPNLKSWPVESVPVQAADGRILMFLRTRAGRIYQSISRDNGLEWGNAEPTPFSNNDSKVACIALPNGHLVLIWNNCQVMDWERRYPLMASVSLDGGRSWAYTVTLNDDGVPAQYPALTSLDGRLKIVYACDGEQLKLVDLPEADLLYAWTAINHRRSWTVSNGLLRVAKGPPVKAAVDWGHWSKAVAFVTGKPKRFALEADLRFDGGIPADASIGVFSSYQDEDNWAALVWQGDGRIALEHQQHFGWTNRGAQSYRESHKVWSAARTAQADRWYHATITQRATSTEIHVTDRDTGEEVFARTVEATFDGHFIAFGAINCAASFAHVGLREIE